MGESRPLNWDNKNTNYGSASTPEAQARAQKTTELRDIAQQNRAKAKHSEHVHTSAKPVSQESRFGGRLQGDRGAIDVEEIWEMSKVAAEIAREKIVNATDWATQRARPEELSKATLKSGEKYSVPTFFTSDRDRPFETIDSLTELESTRNALALVRVKQRSVFGRFKLDKNHGNERVEETEAIYKEAVRMEIIAYMEHIKIQQGPNAMKLPENQLRIYKMLCDEKALRAQAETEALATRKGGKVGRWLANHKGARIGLGLAMMAGGAGAAALGIAPAAAVFGAGMYMTTRGNAERMQARRDKPREGRQLSKQLHAIINQNSLTYNGLLENFATNVSKRGNRVPPDLQEFMNGAQHGVNLPVELKTLIINAYKAEASIGGRPSGIEHWMGANRSDYVADFLSEAMAVQLKSERVLADKRGRGNKWKIAGSVGLGVLGAGAVAGAIGGNMIPAVAGASGFSLAEYILFRRRQEKK